MTTPIRITDLTELTLPLSTDVTVIVDVGTPNETKKITHANLTSVHAALQTGVHGLAITAGKTLTVSENLTLAGASGKTLTLTTDLTNNGAAGTLTWGGAYTLTIPATGTAALRGVANAFTNLNTFSYTSTATSGSIIGVESNMTANPSGASTGIYMCLSFAASTTSANVNNIDQLRGVYGNASMNHNATVAAVTAFEAQAGLGAGCTTGTASATKGLKLTMYKTGGGTISAVRGIELNWNINSASMRGIEINATSQVNAAAYKTGIYIADITGGAENRAIQSYAGLVIHNEGGDAASDVRMEGDTLPNLFMLDVSADSLGINVAAGSIVGMVHIDQSSTTGAKPVLTLDQADVSEEFIRFIGTSANAVLTQSIVEAADVSTATLAGYVKVFIQDDGNQLTDQAYYMPVYTLA